MLRITLQHTVAWAFAHPPRLAWYSGRRQAFIVGNAAEKVVFPCHDPSNFHLLVQRAEPYALRTTVYEALLPPDDYQELAHQGLAGFRFLPREHYDQAFPGRAWGSTCPMDQALISGLTNQLPVQHPTHNTIVAFGPQHIQSYTTNDGGLSPHDRVRARARHRITAVLAQREHNALYYGTNAGEVMAVPVSGAQFGRQQRILETKRPVRGLALRTDGTRLFLGCLGTLSVHAVEAGQYRAAAALTTACRELVLVADRWLIVNQGLHGLSIYDTLNDQLVPVAEHTPTQALDRLIPSADGTTLLDLNPQSGRLRFYHVAYGA